MKVKYARNSKGFSLVELLVALALIGIIIFILTNILLFANRTEQIMTKEYFMQSDIRRVTEVTNELVRYSKAIFAVPQSFVSSTDVMDPGWSFLMLSPDAKRIVIMEYDEDLGRHVENTAVEASADISYYVEFEKDESAGGEGVLIYSIYAYNRDEFGNKTNQVLVFESTVEALNAIQVEDKGTELSPSIALAFRNDGQTSGEGKNEIAYITIIIDTSGSMNDWLGGDRKINSVKEALIGDGSATGTGIIQGFSNEENVFISLVPFSTTANTPSTTSNHYPDSVHDIYEVYNNDEAEELRSQVSIMNAYGGTNTGDALRRAYYLHTNFRSRNNISQTTQVHHYIIMLVDGMTTYEASYVDWEDDGYYVYSGYRERIGNRRYYRFNWETDWDDTLNDDLIPDGNIDLEYLSDDPYDETLERISYGYDTISYKSGYWFYDYTGYIVKYGDQNDDVTNIRITGNGSSIVYDGNDPDDTYVERIGDEIQSYSSNIKSYVIGYANNIDTHVRKIGTDIGTDDDDVYSYSSSGFDLNEIFRHIASDIMADYWLAAGPQIMN